MPPEAVPKRSVCGGAERVGEQVGELGLLLEDEEAEVVGDQVGEGDRDQGVGEAGAQRGQRGRAADRAHAAHAEQVDEADAGEAEADEERVGEAQRGGQVDAGSTSQSKMLSIADLKAPSWAPSKLVVAIEAITTAAEPGSVAQRVAAESGRRRPSRPSLDPEAAELGEHPEVDREDLAALAPLLDPEQGHHRQRVAAVDEGGDGGRVRGEADGDAAAGAVDDLQPDEGDAGRPPPASGRAAPGRRGGPGAARRSPGSRRRRPGRPRARG